MWPYSTKKGLTMISWFKFKILTENTQLKAKDTSNLLIWLTLCETSLRGVIRTVDLVWGMVTEPFWWVTNKALVPCGGEGTGLILLEDSYSLSGASRWENWLHPMSQSSGFLVLLSKNIHYRQCIIYRGKVRT